MISNTRTRLSSASTTLFKDGKCLIAGRWIQPEASIPVTNPGNGKVVGNAGICSAAMTAEAIRAAQQEHLVWKSVPGKDKASVLRKWARLQEEHCEELAELMTMEQGKPLEEARGEVKYSAAYFDWFADEARRMYGDVIESNVRDQKLIVQKSPVGVVGIITPWNFPLAMISRKIAPAIAAGCGVVVKPSEFTPFSALALMELGIRAGVPPALINCVIGHANEIGQELTSNPLVRKISFTGSTRIGKLLLEQCSKQVKRVSMELGGNAPFIVFEDADLEKAADGLIACKFRNAGQTCVSANRIFVHDMVYEKFTSIFVEKVSKLKVGKGTEENVKVGPLINEAAVEKVVRHINDAVEKGGEIAFGGSKIDSETGSFFHQPTVLVNASTKMLCFEEETFGPFAPLYRFYTEDEVVDMANDTNCGLAAYYYTKDLKRIFRLSERLEYGMFGVNAGILSTEVAPFGGVKESGLGREGSKYGINDYIDLKYSCINLN